MRPLPLICALLILPVYALAFYLFPMPIADASPGQRVGAVVAFMALWPLLVVALRGIPQRSVPNDAP